MNIEELKKWGIQTLKQNQIEDANLQVKRLLAYILQVETSYLIRKEKEEVNHQQEQNFKENIQQIIEGKPIQYITHTQEFMKLSFYVDKQVLIPQPDTECLVEAVLNIAKPNPNPKILDMCTGSGCIGISLATYLTNSQITISDISKQALEVAKKNITRNQVEKQITCIQSDMFEQLSTEEKWDILVSNPPYITQEEMKTLPESVKQEPKLALEGGKDGLKFYKILLKEAPNYIKKEGYVCLEIGYTQKKAVQEIAQNTGNYQDITCLQDLAGLDRVIIATLK